MSTVDDRDLERYLRGDDAVSRAYSELKAERPSPALDQAVLARARDALKSTGSARPARSLNWPVLTALAATVLLSFGLVMRLALEPESQVPTAAPAQDAVSTMPGESAPALEAREAPSAESQTSTPFGGTARDTGAPASSIEEQRPRIEAEIRATAEQAPAVPEPVPPPAAASPVHVPQSAPADSGARNAAPASAPPREERAIEVSAPGRDLLRAKKAEAPATAMTSNRESAALADEQVILTPEAWLEEIARLRGAGETEAAARELARFRDAYPDYDYEAKLEAFESPPERQ